MDNKVIIIGGCSFTAMHGSWARQLEKMYRKPHKVQTVAKHGAGNDFIARSIIYEVDRQEKLGTPATHVFVMWSGTSRHELYLDDKIFTKCDPYSTHISTFKRKGKHGEQLKENELDFAWIKSGGTYKNIQLNASSIDYENELMSKYFDHYYRVQSHNYFNFRSMENFHYVQNYCKLKQITLINLTFRDIIGPIHESISPSFVAKDKDSIHDHAYLYGLIDWNNWHFHKDFGGLREWNLDNTNKWDDGYDNHPHEDAHIEYIEKFIKPNIINRGIL